MTQVHPTAGKILQQKPDPKKIIFDRVPQTELMQDVYFKNIKTIQNCILQ